MQLDLAQPKARDIARDLALQADVVIDNFSVGVLDRWGIGYDDVSPGNPGVIYVGMSGMGVSGPWSNYVTYAPTVHALAGLTYLTGVPGRNDIGSASATTTTWPACTARSPYSPPSKAVGSPARASEST